jgi:hypothetical protein
MTRVRNRAGKRRVLELEQNGTCLVCNYPLILGCHIHHVIAHEHGGPDHPLNLVAFCPNHHTVLEHVRHHVAPSAAQRNAGWLTRATAALEVIKVMPEETGNLFSVLAEPYPLHEPLRQGVPASYRTYLAADVARADAKLLLTINRRRPFLLAIWLYKQKGLPLPTTDDGWTRAKSEATANVGPGDFASIVRVHLDALGLPFDPAWLDTI